MKKVLLVDDDLTLHKLLDAGLSKYKDEFELFHANDGEEGITILKQEGISVLVTDMVMPGVDGFTLLHHMMKNYREIPCIIMTSYNIPGLEEKMLSKGYHFLEKPVRPALLAQTIKLAVRQGGMGLGRMSVPGIIQLIESEGRSCLVHIHHSESREGELFFSQGTLFDAKFGKLTGEEAALQLIGMDDVQVNCRNLPEERIVRRINKSAQHLILFGMQLKDEVPQPGSDALASSNRELLDEGIGWCEKLIYKKAQDILKVVITADPTNGVAWLWMSRTLFDMEKIQVALKEARRLDPKNRDTAIDIEKANSALKISIKKIIRCPFCFAPMGSDVDQCHFCKAYVLVDSKTLPKMGGPVDKMELKGALERFERILMVEVNKSILFYAGLGFMNLGELDKALEYFGHLDSVVLGDNILKTTIAEVLRFISVKQGQGSEESGENGNGKNRKTVIDENILPDGSVGKKILIVEDSALTRKIIKRIFHENSFAVIEAEDGIEALAILKDHKPDLILLDIVMPKLDGYDVLRLLKKDDDLKGIPVIMMTAENKFQEKIKARFSAANAYLTKPFKPEQLMEQVNKCID